LEIKEKLDMEMGLEASMSSKDLLHLENSLKEMFLLQLGNRKKVIDLFNKYT